MHLLGVIVMLWTEPLPTGTVHKLPTTESYEYVDHDEA